ncbi:MAG: ribonuclease J [Bacillota bacterium]
MARDYLDLIFLGGLGEIGKNMMAVEYEEDILVIDCGLAFPDENMLGIDVVLPDFTYLLENKERVRAVFLTHGHEDHIGALPYFLRSFDIPVYGTRLTLGLVRAKLAEFGGATSFDGRALRPRQMVEVGAFRLEPFRVNHSIADCVGLAIHTPVGTIVHSGDFKFDQTPVDGEVADFHKLAELGDNGVLCLLSDSTNADRGGYTDTERVVGRTLNEVMSAAEGRVLVASFASNVHRIQQVVDAAVRHHRQVAVVGRSMENVVAIAREMGYLRAPEGTFVELEALRTVPARHAAVLTTGSQGEPMSALARMSSGENRRLQVEPGDVVVLAATPVPGNETMVARTVDNLFRRGARVLYQASAGVHVSGHGSQEELKLMLNLTRPRYFLPIHGEYRHLVHHSDLALDLGIPRGNILVGENGHVFRLDQESARLERQVPAGTVLVDGLGVGDVGNVVLRDRRQLAADGVLVVALAVDAESGQVLSGPDIVSRGFVYMRESEALLEDTRKRVQQIIDRQSRKNRNNISALRNALRESLMPYLLERTGRRPVVMPIILEI